MKWITKPAMRLLAASAGFISSAAATAEPAFSGACEREMARAAQVENIPLSVLYSVGLTEAGQRGRLRSLDGRTDE